MISPLKRSALILPSYTDHDCIAQQSKTRFQNLKFVFRFYYKTRSMRLISKFHVPQGFVFPSSIPRNFIPGKGLFPNSISYFRCPLFRTSFLCWKKISPFTLKFEFPISSQGAHFRGSLTKFTLTARSIKLVLGSLFSKSCF